VALRIFLFNANSKELQLLLLSLIIAKLFNIEDGLLLWILGDRILKTTSLLILKIFFYISFVNF
jgi:hypothetical protein